MLNKFKVKGYKGFTNEIVLDLTNHNDYQFNKELIKNNIINKAIVYGKNGSGKSNLGFALFDIVFHLTDNNKNMREKINDNYINMDNNENYVEFYYEFTFGKDILKYSYKKEDLDKLLYEELYLNNELLIKYDFNNKKNRIINIEEAKTLNWKIDNEDLSVLKYIYNNTVLNKDNVINKLFDFVNGMLWFRSVDFNGFIGLRSTSELLNNIIIDNHKTKDFNDFLTECGIDYNLCEAQTPMGKILTVKKNNKVAPFDTIISSGTKALWLYYCWEIYFDKVKFLFIDEFDATYHFELAAKIVDKLNKQKNFQTILTSHNTYLMTNKLSRPDCTFIITPTSIKNLSSCTDKELREAHNIEKLYREGVFTE